jgi:UDP-N-acetylmuramate--alanine ligase
MSFENLTNENRLENKNGLLLKVKKVHFVGIGGAGMCALAEIMFHRGYELTGSDVNESETLARIKKLGIPVTMQHLAENIGDAELVIHTAAVHPDNIELVTARQRNIPVLERAELMGLITAEYAKTIAVSGTHGKTTTTSMITQILVMAGLDPTALIGGKLPFIGGNSRVGNSELMVCEACEFVDSFLELHPAISLILNIDTDHLDYFKTLDNLIAHFTMFTGITSETVIYNGDDANTLKAIANTDKNKKLKMITFGFNEHNDFYANNIRMNENSRYEFDIIHKNEKFAHILLNVPGRHNILNAVAACAVCAYVSAPAEDIERGLETFTGAGRRFEILGTVNGVTIADDYAHHPTEVKLTLQAAKQMNYKRVWAVFQPFTFSRTVLLMNEFADALRVADKVVLAEIMGSREKNTYNVYSKDLAEKVPGSVWFATFEEISEYVVKNASAGDLVITLGCGDIYKAAKLMLKS